jgi:anti-sigma B factor antagonist
MYNFGVKERQVGNVTVLDIHGKLRGCGSGGILRDAINHLPEEGHARILLNLARVSDIDSSCLGVLISSQFDLTNKGGQLKIVHLSQNLQELMSLAKLLTVFDVYKDESEAIDSFEPSSLELVEYRNTLPSEPYHALHPSIWGALGMSVTFRAELMQDRSHLDRSFSVKELLPSGRVTLNGIHGEFIEKMFEPVQYAVQ